MTNSDAAIAAAGRERGRIQLRIGPADPIVDAEERRAGARIVRAGTEIAVRDEVGLRALNDALRTVSERAWRAS